MANQTRNSRARTSSIARQAAAGAHSATDPLEELQQAIEAGRERLMMVEALLHCVALAMNEREGRGTQDPDYQTLVALGHDLLKQSIDGLDSLRLKPLLLKLGARGRDEVKEERGEYLH